MEAFKHVKNETVKEEQAKEITQMSLQYAVDVENIGMAIAKKLNNNDSVSITTNNLGESQTISSAINMRRKI